MAIFAIRYDYVDDPELLDTHRAEHRAFLRGLHEAGTLLLSGPFADDGPAGALLIAQGDSPEQVAAAFDDDPFRRVGAITERTVRPWTVVIGSLGG